MCESKEFFPKETTGIIKGIAIILMLTLHLLRPEWMQYPEKVIDIHVGNATITEIFARGGDICIGMFAFITGYGWESTFEKKSKIKRVFGPGGSYWTYWIILVLFSFPIRAMMTQVIDNSVLLISLGEIIKSLCAFSSKSVVFGWYIYFFAMAVFSFGFWRRVIDKIKWPSLIKIYFVCGVAFFLRIISKVMFSKVFLLPMATSIFSHYFQWMPVIIIGYITKKEKMFDVIYEFWSKTSFKKLHLYFCLCGCLGIYGGKCIFQYCTKIYSNFDSLLIFPFMYCICGLAKWVISKKILSKVLSELGDLSIYIWLSHSVLLYQPMQKMLIFFRIPIIILLVSFAIMVPIGWFLRVLDKGIQKVQIKLAR